MLDGICAMPVQVEVDISMGMPVFDMVGYLSPEVREAKERVRTALHNCGILLPAKRITVNLSPANIRNDFVWSRRESKVVRVLEEFSFR